MKQKEMRCRCRIGYVVVVLLVAANGCNKERQLEEDGNNDDDDSNVIDDDSFVDDDDSANSEEIEFTEISSGESEGDGIGDSTTCNQLNVALIGSQTELESIYQAELSSVYTNEGTPLEIDFYDQIGILSYTTYCPHLGFRLVVDSVQVTIENNIVLEETIWHPDGYLSVDGRTYNLIAIETRNVNSVTTVLNEEYEE